MSGLPGSSGLVGATGLWPAEGALAGVPHAGNADAPSSVPFAGVLKAIVQQTSALDEQATQAVTGVLSGRGVDIHDAMIATQKADIAFQLALEIRNKAVSAYQQMMAMQF